MGIEIEIYSLFFVWTPFSSILPPPPPLSLSPSPAPGLTAAKIDGHWIDALVLHASLHLLLLLYTVVRLEHRNHFFSSIFIFSRVINIFCCVLYWIHTIYVFVYCYDSNAVCDCALPDIACIPMFSPAEKKNVPMQFTLSSSIGKMFWAKAVGWLTRRATTICVCACVWFSVASSARIWFLFI